MNIPCQFLEWDSHFFGLRIARITTNRLAQNDMDSILSWCKEHDITCAYLLADSDHQATIERAEAYGFGMKDVRVTLEYRTSPKHAAHYITLPQGLQVRLALPADVEALEAIAQVCHTNTRFYVDQRFARETVDALYRTWIRKSCAGYADAVFVLTYDTTTCGYFSCHIPDVGVGEIGLVGLAPDVAGRGWGHFLLRAALQWFHDQNVELVTVVTQGRNIRAQRLYQRAGFVSRSTHIWYHKWFDV